jgi:hypothetical protein
MQGDTGPVTDAGNGGGPPINPALCEPGTRVCQTQATYGICDATGTSIDTFPCAATEFCDTSTGSCVPGLCRPRAIRCGEGPAREQCAEDGQSWVPYAACERGEYCSEGGCLPVACLPQVVFAFDGSSSMSSQFDAIRGSIRAVASANPDVAFGLAQFPTGLGCSIGDGSRGLFGGTAPLWPDVPITADGGAAIDAWFAANRAAGGATPLVAMLEWFGENADAVWGAERESAHLVVLSEGADTCRCQSNDRDPRARETCWVNNLGAATRTLAARGVKVYVIGYRYSDAPAALNAIAENGDTPFATFIQAGNEATLTAAFGEVITSAKICQP